jgi:hypothetical protein
MAIIDRSKLAVRSRVGAAYSTKQRGDMNALHCIDYVDSCVAYTFGMQILEPNTLSEPASSCVTAAPWLFSHERKDMPYIL